MSKPERESWCENCRYWGREREHDQNMPVGTCRVLAPSITRPQVLAYHDPERPEETGPLIDRAHWPWTAFDDWCGSFVPAAPEATP